MDLCRAVCGHGFIKIRINVRDKQTAAVQKKETDPFVSRVATETEMIAHENNVSNNVRRNDNLAIIISGLLINLVRLSSLLHRRVYSSAYVSLRREHFRIAMRG